MHGKDPLWCLATICRLLRTELPLVQLIIALLGEDALNTDFFSFDIYSKIFMQNVMNSSMSALEV